jgi:hypothetical protein
MADPLKPQQLRELLSNRIQSGEQLRRELVTLFDESARSVLGPVTDDLRKASAAALDDLQAWRQASAELMRQLSEQASETMRAQAGELQRSSALLEGEMQRSAKSLQAAFEREASACSNSLSTASTDIVAALDRMVPAIHDTLRVTGEVQSAVSAAATESAELLRQVSDRGLLEAQRAATTFEDVLRPMLAGFTEQYSSAYLNFEKNSGDFLALQRKHAEDVGVGFSAMETQVASLVSSVTDKVDRLANLVMEELEKTQEAQDSALTSIGEMESRLAQAAIVEAGQVKNQVLELGVGFRAAVQEIDEKVERLSSDLELRDEQAARLARQRLWTQVSIVVFLTLVLAVMLHH